MSYASIASHNIPAGEMPKPDQNLTDGHFAGEDQAHADVDHKINILPAGSDVNHPPVSHTPPPRPEAIHINPPASADPYVSESAPKPVQPPKSGKLPYEEHIDAYEKSTPAQKEQKKQEVKKEAKEKISETEDTVEEKTEEYAEAAKKKTDQYAEAAKKKTDELEDATKKTAKKLEKKGKELTNKAKAEFDEVESKLGPYWEKTKDVVLRPGTLGGLMGIVNVGILGTAGYFAYTRRDQPWDRRIVGGAVAGTLALFSAEGYVADSYLQTDEGRAEAERAKAEGSKFYLEAKERVLRPQVAGGLLGAVNVAILGTVGYFAYQNWNRPWDRRTVSAVSAGLVALSGLEGWAGAEYKEKEYPKRK